MEYKKSKVERIQHRIIKAIKIAKIIKSGIIGRIDAGIDVTASQIQKEFKSGLNDLVWIDKVKVNKTMNMMFLYCPGIKINIPEVVQYTSEEGCKVFVI